MDNKIVFFDVDGTITHHEDGSISSKTKEAIKTLKSKGTKVVAATGRPLSMCKEISMNGIKDNGVLKALKETLSLNEYPAINQLIYNQEVF
jgi:HAD superfamily hydrolase (TIGR01484 family)